MLNSDGSLVIGSSYVAALGPEWSRVALRTGQGYEVFHCNELLFNAFTSEHHCTPLCPNKYGERDGDSYGRASNFSLEHGNSNQCASKMNTFVYDPLSFDTAYRLPTLTSMRESYNPYSAKNYDLNASTDPTELADATLSKLVLDSNARLDTRIWVHRNCTFMWKGTRWPCLKRTVHHGYKCLPKTSTLICIYRRTPYNQTSIYEWRLVPKEYEKEYENHPNYLKTTLREKDVC